MSIHIERLSDIGELPSDGSFLLGDPTVDGSWQIVRTGDTLDFQRRESGTWVSKGAMTP